MVAHGLGKPTQIPFVCGGPPPDDEDDDEESMDGGALAPVAEGEEGASDGCEEESPGHVHGAGKRPMHPQDVDGPSASPLAKRHSPFRFGGSPSEPSTDDVQGCLEYLLLTQRQQQQKLVDQQVLISTLTTDQARTDRRIADSNTALESLRGEVSALRGLKVDSRRLAGIDRVIQEIQGTLSSLRRPDTGPVTVSPTPDWKSPEAIITRPTSEQLQTLVHQLHERAIRRRELPSIARILNLTDGACARFNDGKLTFVLGDEQLDNKTLWQLWAYAVARHPIAECLPRSAPGQAAPAREYTTAVRVCNSMRPVFFVASAASTMAPPLTLPATVFVAADATPTASLSHTLDHLGLVTPPVGSSAMVRCASSMSVASEVSFGGSATPAPPPSPAFNVEPHLREACETFAHASNGKQPSQAMREVAAAFLTAYLPRRAAILSANRRDEEDRKAERPLQLRGEHAECPEWPTGMPAAPPVGGDAGSSCRGCGKKGILTECSGCGFSYHFDCCDPTRQPPGGDVPWYCGRGDVCEQSRWRAVCGWAPRSLPLDQWECSVCKEDLNVGLQATLVGCSCVNDRVCVSCAHCLIERRDGDTLFCPTCKGSSSAIQRPGGPPVHYCDMVAVSADVSDDSVRAVVRARRHGGTVVTERDRIEAEAVRDARVASTNEAIVANGMGGEAATMARLEAQGGDDVDVAGMIADEPVDADEGAAHLAAARAETYSRSAAYEARQRKQAQRSASTTDEVEAVEHTSPSADTGERTFFDPTSPGAPASWSAARAAPVEAAPKPKVLPMASRGGKDYVHPRDRPVAKPAAASKGRSAKLSAQPADADSSDED